MSERKSSGHAIETMQIEERRFKPSPEFSRQANAQPDIYDQGFDEFWTNEAGRISWFAPCAPSSEATPPPAKWYIGGKIQVCYNWVDRHWKVFTAEQISSSREAELNNERRRITFGDL